MRTMARHVGGIKLMDVVDRAFKNAQKTNKTTSRQQNNQNTTATGVEGGDKVAQKNDKGRVSVTHRHVVVEQQRIVGRLMRTMAWHTGGSKHPVAMDQAFKKKKKKRVISVKCDIFKPLNLYLLIP
jgi:hypothetical protein